MASKIIKKEKERVNRENSIREIVKKHTQKVLNINAAHSLNPGAAAGLTYITTLETIESIVKEINS